MHIRVINPTITESWNEPTRRTYAGIAREGTEVSVVSLDWGTASVESFRDESIAPPDVLNKVVQAEKDGVDAVIIDCMADPGMHAARELVRIPVIGPAQASMHLAAMLGHKFSMLVLFEHHVHSTERQVMMYGLAGKLASARAFNIPVLSLEDDLESTLSTLVDVAEKTVREDGAHVIVPGCTGLAGLAGRIQSGLAGRGCEVPVLDPPLVAMKLAESLVELGQTHSERTYPKPPSKEIRWPAVAGFVT